MAQKIPGYEAYATSLLGHLSIDMGLPGKVDKCLVKLFELEKTEPGQQVSYHISYLYAALDKADKTFSYLSKSVSSRDSSLLHIARVPVFSKYNSDPRFIEILKKIGLK
ncbi:MAG: hypothetical protein HQ541_10190 [Mariniphaga sp.]|nr:hypothetical protein [Mariniphaga sp.]